MHRIADPEQRKKVLAKLRGKPWDGLFDSTVAAALATKYGFKPDFDLAGALCEAIWRYGRQATAPMQPFSKSELDGNRIDSISTAVHVGLWKANNQRSFAQSSNRNCCVVHAKRYFEKSKRVEKHKRGGRLPDSRTIVLIRTVAAIYQNGTGKKISLAHSRYGFRGAAYRFLVDVCSEMNMRLTHTHVREMEFRSIIISRRKQKKALADSVNQHVSVDNIMFSWSK